MFGAGNEPTSVDFNSHAHVERDLGLTPDDFQPKNFNSHAHVERDRSAAVVNFQPCQFQLTRSRGA